VTARTPLTLQERETIIRFDESQGPASTFTYNRRWQKHLEEKLGIKREWSNGRGGKEYSIPKARVSLPRAPRRLSEGEKARLREQGRRLVALQGRQRGAESVLSGAAREGGRL